MDSGGPGKSPNEAGRGSTVTINKGQQLRTHEGTKQPGRKLTDSIHGTKPFI